LSTDCASLSRPQDP